MTTPSRATVLLVAPFGGRAVPLADLPDPVYAGGAVGRGLAIDPDETEGGRAWAAAPCPGRVTAAFPHAVMIEPGPGRAVLLHLGSGTRRLSAEGFDTLTLPGRHVQAGQPVLAWEPRRVLDAGGSLLCPVVALQARAEDVVLLVEPGERVGAGQPLLLWS